jgi:hypothetical protein
VNFGELKTEIIRFAKRADLADQAANYVSRAGDMIARKARTLEMVSTSTLTDGNRLFGVGPIYSLPADIVAPISIYGLQGATAYKLLMVSTQEIRRYSVSADPLWACVSGRRVEFRGVPATGSSFDLTYFARPAEFLSGDLGSNTVLAGTPELYLHGSLHWLHLECQDIDMAQAHLDLFTAAVEDLNRQADRTMAAAASSLNEAAGTFGSAM